MIIYYYILNSVSCTWNCTPTFAHPCILLKYPGLFFPSHLSQFLKYILLIVLLQLSQFFPLCPPLSFPLVISPLSLCPWIVHISSLASPFPILFLTSHCIFLATNYAFQSLYLFPILPVPLSTNSPPNDLHIYDSVPVLVVCLVCFCFLDSVVHSCEFVVILMFIVLIIFFFLDKSL